MDDHRLFIEGLSYLLLDIDQGLEMDLAQSAEQAIQLIEQGERYQLLIADLAMPEMDGFSLLRALQTRRIAIPTLIISSSSRISTINRVIHLGAAGYINKSATGKEMKRAVETVLHGKLYFPDRVWAVLDAYPQPIPSDSTGQAKAADGFGSRRIEVLQLVADGLTNKQIGYVLNIAEVTVKYHLSVLFKQLEVKNRTALIKTAKQRGIIGND